ncbi:MAG: hypothetical protein ACJZ8Q_04030 [Paracoccaceae bacterium]
MHLIPKNVTFTSHWFLDAINNASMRRLEDEFFERVRHTVSGQIGQ